VPPELMRYLEAHKGRSFRNSIPYGLPKVIARQERGRRSSAAMRSQRDLHGLAPGRYIGAVVEAGKREYPLPVYVNAWLVAGTTTGGGDYPAADRYRG